MSVELSGLRLYLLAGLVGHKVLWEWMKRRPAPPTTIPSLRTRLVKLVKIAVLVGIAAQTLAPEILPIGDDGAVARRWAGVAIYTVGLATALAARLQLGDNWSDIESARVDSGHTLVARGVYSLIRHPIYTADLALLLGLQLALNSWLVLGVAALAPLVLYKAVREERMLAEQLAGYSDYCRRTKRFIPYVV